MAFSNVSLHFSPRDKAKLDRALGSDRVFAFRVKNARGHSEMGSRHHGMVEFGVQIPMAPYQRDKFELVPLFSSFIDCGALRPSFAYCRVIEATFGNSNWVVMELPVVLLLYSFVH
jgi:hypothetical protein